MSTTLTFHDVPSAVGCECPSCSAVELARTVRRLRLVRPGRGPARTPQRTVVAVAAAGSALAAAGSAQAAQGAAVSAAPAAAPAALPGATALPGHSTAVAWTGRHAKARHTAIALDLTRAEIVARAARWVDSRIPYSRSRFHDGYRTDCSGFVSMAWGLADNAWTGNLADFAVPISKDDLAEGDILLFHNPAAPARGSHVVLFDHWANRSHTAYVGYEQSPPHTLRRTIPYGYFTHRSQYRAYRYRHLVSGDADGSSFPGVDAFGPGTVNSWVTRLGTMLMARGGSRFYTDGPGPEWGDADASATRAFQQAQGWEGAEADGLPGPHTWRLLVTGAGRDIPADDSVEDFPGVDDFTPGTASDPVLAMGQQLVARGFADHYRIGPTPVWTEADRRNIQDFQRAQGWHGDEADGYPGPRTWQLLFD
ncbi:peptidoglycan-binding protein [Peterkaempfera sp. SMS 1(5)a]|uniref:peptidoglycan-binding protein n=1 Tax=Peterkaempfera podocarpi TaxID=3232308 RepID=UPI00366CA4C5